MRKPNLIIVLFTALLTTTEIIPHTCFAKDFGKYGPVFEVKEEGFLSMVQRKLKLIDIEKEYKKMLEIAKKKVTEPMPVQGIKSTTEPRSFTYDPSYTLKEDIILPDGKLLHKAGTKINPLNHISLDKKLIFIDGNDSEQIEWFKNQLKNLKIKEKDKLILIAGKPIELAGLLNQEVYFDQSGVLTTKFNIQQVPAIVEQDKDIFRIHEIAVETIN